MAIGLPDGSETALHAEPQALAQGGRIAHPKKKRPPGEGGREPIGTSRLAGLSDTAEARGMACRGALSGGLGDPDKCILGIVCDGPVKHLRSLLGWRGGGRWPYFSPNRPQHRPQGVR